eukprot:m51a1_g5260 putative acyltransferase 3 (242) ;mRNA; f:105525-106799
MRAVSPRAEESSVVAVQLETAPVSGDRIESENGKSKQHEGSQATATRRVDIQVLRALAVSAVLLFHLGWVQGGFVGVDIFFVISGFLVFGSVVRGLEGSGHSLVEFYARRAKRISPPSALMLLVLLCVLWRSGYCAGHEGCRAQYSDIQWAALQGANVNQLLKKGGYFVDTDPSIVLHFWSLAVEEQLYVAVPLMFWVLRLLCRTTATYSRVVGPFLALTALVSFETICKLPSNRGSDWVK